MSRASWDFEGPASALVRFKLIYRSLRRRKEDDGVVRTRGSISLVGRWRGQRTRQDSRHSSVSAPACVRLSHFGFLRPLLSARSHCLPLRALYRSRSACCTGRCQTASSEIELNKQSVLYGPFLGANAPPEWQSKKLPCHVRPDEEAIHRPPTAKVHHVSSLRSEKCQT